MMENPQKTSQNPPVHTERESFGVWKEPPSQAEAQEMEMVGGIIRSRSSQGDPQKSTPLLGKRDPYLPSRTLNPISLFGFISGVGL